MWLQSRLVEPWNRKEKNIRFTSSRILTILPYSLSKEENKPGDDCASACVTTLVEGGWELKRYDVPAQYILLDYSGCKKHWHGTGIATELDIRKLKRILN
jgi:hypothetical protein